jgi:Zn finger protein HypA/HybF involved in hydrogenase expression
MGQTKNFKCKKCGNVWTHYSGVGFENKKFKGCKKDNTTGDADRLIKCPQCGSTDFEDVGGDMMMFD